MSEIVDTPVVDSPSTAGDSSLGIASTPAGDSGAAGGASQTDEQILGLDTEVADPSTETAEVTDEQPVDAQATQQELADNYDWAKPLFKQYPKLQSAIDRIKAYEGAGPLADIRKMVELGDLQTLTGWKQMAEQTEQVDLAFSSGDPASQQFAIKSMYELDPDAFEATLPMSVEFLRQSDPTRFSAIEGQLLTDLLAPNKFPEHMDLLAQALEKGDVEGLKNLAQQLVGWSKSKQLTGKQEQQTLDPRTQNIERQQQQINAQKVEAFTSTVSSKVYDGVSKHLDSLMANVTKDAAYNPKQIADIRKTILNTVGERLAADQSANLQFRALLNKSTWLEKADEAVAARVAKAKAILPTVMKEVLDEKSELFLSGVQARREKINTASQRREVGGTGGNVRAPNTKLTQKDANKMDPMDVLNA